MFNNSGAVSVIKFISFTRHDVFTCINNIYDNMLKDIFDRGKVKDAPCVIQDM